MSTQTSASTPSWSTAAEPARPGHHLHNDLSFRLRGEKRAAGDEGNQRHRTYDRNQAVWLGLFIAI
jgi:hypothetical protein